MSETLLAAMAKCRTPEEFVERFVLRALRVRRLPSARAWARNRPGSNERFNNFLRSLGKGECRAIVFVNASDRSKKCQFIIGRTELTHKGKVSKKGQPDPHAKLFGGGALFHLSPADYRGAVSSVGETSEMHPGSHGSISHELLFPGKLASHDGWNARILPRSKQGTVSILLGDETFEKLSAHRERERFLLRYLKTTSLLTAMLEESSYLKSLGLSSVALLGKYTPYQRFHLTHREQAPFMREMANASKQGAIKRIIKRNLKAGEHLALEYAEGLAELLKYRDRRAAAKKMADDSRLEVHEITVG